jgi:hypothetical protein
LPPVRCRHITHLGNDQPARFDLHVDVVIGLNPTGSLKPKLINGIAKARTLIVFVLLIHRFGIPSNRAP